MRLLLSLLKQLVPWSRWVAFHEARSSYLRHDLDKAAGAARAAMLRFGDDARPCALLGHTLRAQGDPRAAAAALREACARAPCQPSYLIELAETLQELGRPTEALTTYDLALSVGPRVYAAWHGRGLLLMEARRFEAAARSFGTALDHGPGSVAAHCLYAYCLAYSGEPMRAAEIYRLVLLRSPEHPRARYNVGACLYLAGHHNEAREAFTRALRFDPSDQRSQAALGQLPPAKL